MSTIINQLLEMGFMKEEAEMAVSETNSLGILEAIEWIERNQNKEKNENTSKTSILEGDLNKQNTDDNSSLIANSYKCETCKKLLTTEDLQLHSARTGHVDFTESTDQIKPLTEEEKQAQIEKIKQYMAKKKIQRSEEERVRLLEDEKRRRQQGKTIVSAKIKFQEEEMKRIALETKREKKEDQIYREKLRAEMAKEKEEKALRAQNLKSEISETVQPPSNVPVQITTTTLKSNECRLQIRTPDNSHIVGKFIPSNTLDDVAVYASKNWPNISPNTIDKNQLTFMTLYPTRKFTAADNSECLESLGLCPSAVLICQLKPAPLEESLH